ncbi:metal ABC transporter ATP-binding protein [Tuberibacillus sp. Marseille-P3662]|uniref:metal ABC transporter ATP-binding protein n=1 Tax=Tuberibacillus sp. Marseille-P3662 TaxID=1965358 RepID=UPI000A1CA29D|nr:metal ABC transporter ATP-binding protein [Tuberibacillus sp. Marseille-P3662]
MTNDSKSIIDVSNVSYTYDKQQVLDHINLTINSGEVIGLAGPNGSGKSTLIKIILGLLRDYKGQVNLFDQPQKIFRHWHKIGYVSQKSNSFNSGFPATVYEVVAMGLYNQKKIWHWLNRQDKLQIQETLATVGMAAHAKRPIGELSGGQQQRVFIARALVSDPDLLIFDEPTVGIDEASVKAFYELLTYLKAARTYTILLVTHDIDAMSAIVDRITYLNQGSAHETCQIKEGDPDECH